jgi:putative PIN family toxin of toxin-antitoxin system
MRVVFDTNILVSAFVTARGRGEAALLRTLEGTDRLLVSKAIIDELLGVLARKFSRDREQLARIAVFLADIGELVDPELKIHRLADDPDNRILECAVDGHADAIVTGDRALLQLKNFEGIPIPTLKSYLSGDSDT